MNQHTIAAAWARMAFKDAYKREPSDSELLVLLGVALIESGYGQAWKGAGVGSNNMGAVQAGMPPCKENQFSYKDSHPQSDGTSVSYDVCFKKYASPEDGMRDLVKQLYQMRAPVLSAAAVGDLNSVSAWMYDTHYFEGRGADRGERIANHVEALRSGVQTASAGTGIPFHETGSAALDASSLVPLALGGLGALTLLMLARRRKRA